MAYKIRVISKKQELKKPDEFVSTMDQLAEAARTRARLLLAILGILILLGGAIGGFVWYSIRQEQSASLLGIEAARYYHSASGGPVESIPQGTGGPQSLRAENLSKAVELYQQVVAQYPRTKTAALSRYYLGNSYLELGDYDNAISAYQVFIQRHPGSSFLVAMAWQRLGYAYLAKGDLKQAETSFEAVANSQEAQNKDQSLFEIGRLREVQGRKQEAVPPYQEIVNKYPDSVLAAEAKARLRALGVVELQPALTEKPIPGQTPPAENIQSAPLPQSEAPSKEAPPEAPKENK